MIPQIQVLTVGRVNSTARSDIEIPATEDSVGRRHAELTLGAAGECYLVDLGSANGTFIQNGKQWVKIQQGSLTLQTPLRLGSYQTTIADLLRFRRIVASPPPLPVAVSSPKPSLPLKQATGKPRRNPTTGEIE